MHIHEDVSRRQHGTNVVNQAGGNVTFYSDAE